MFYYKTMVIFYCFLQLRSPSNFFGKDVVIKDEQNKVQIKRLRPSATTADISKKCLNIELVLSALSGLRGGISTNKGVSLPRSIPPRSEAFR
jgi:hypothetical protein